MGVLEGKKAAIFGVANDHSIAWAIARAMREAGAELALSYAGEALERRVRPLAASIGVDTVLPCDVASDSDIAGVFEALRQCWGGLDVLVHAVAFAPRDALKGRFLDTSRDDFRVALEISAYSLIALSRAAAPLMEGRRGAVVTLTYLGAERVFPNYNMMGVAKAALESSVRYLASRSRPCRHSRQRHFGRADSDSLCRRRCRLSRHAAPPRRRRRLAPQRVRRGGGADRAVPLQ